MKNITLFSVAFVVLLFVGTVSPKDKQPAFPIKTVKQSELPTELLWWMSERYDAKTLIGLKWKNMDKAKLSWAINRAQIPVVRGGSLFFAREPGAIQRSRRTDKIPSMRMDISPAILQTSPDVSYYYGTYTYDVYDIKLTVLGSILGWNVGYSKVSMGHDDLFWWGEKETTTGNILFASLVLSPPAESIAPYLYFGPARVKYTYSKTTTDIDFDPITWSLVTTTSSFEKSKSVFTWILGVGFSYTFPGSGLGFFMEYKHIPEVDDFVGIDNFGLGFSILL